MDLYKKRWTVRLFYYSCSHSTGCELPDRICCIFLQGIKLNITFYMRVRNQKRLNVLTRRSRVFFLANMKIQFFESDEQLCLLTVLLT